MAALPGRLLDRKPACRLERTLWAHAASRAWARQNPERRA
jgi:hypothetical protein